MRSSKFYTVLFSLICAGVFCTGCKDNTYTVPDGVKGFTNDCLKRSTGPNMVGSTIDFSYAMAMPFHSGNITLAKVEASIPGDAGTYMEHRSFHTGTGGQDVGVEIGDPSVTEGASTTVVFTRDTCASTLRYYYQIPEEARGKKVSFKFSAVDDKGKSVSYKMGPYQISNMDMKLDIELKNNQYFSIADMAAYDASAIAEMPEKADFVYLFRSIRGVAFRHAFVSPNAGNVERGYLPGVNLPAGVEKSTPLLKTFSSSDQQLARNEYGVFVDDLDLQTIDLSSAPDYGINIAQNAGAWLETADGQYRAYVYVNTASETRAGMTISIKRLKVK